MLTKEFHRYRNLVGNVSNWKSYIRTKVRGFEGKTAIEFNTRTGLQIKVPVHLISAFKEIFMSEAYLQHFPMPLSQVRTVVDVGANIGFFSLWAAHRFPNARIVAVEPFPNNFAELKNQINRNELTRVRCYQRAMAKSAGARDFFTSSNEGFSVDASVYGTKELSHKTEVSTITLEALLRENEIVTCDFLKLDCEGAEFEILESALSSLLKKIRFIAAEVHEDLPSRSIETLIKKLRSEGFTTYQDGKTPIRMLWACRSC